MSIQKPKKVEDICRVLIDSVINQRTFENSNIKFVSFNTEYYESEGVPYFRVGFEYRVNYKIKDDEYDFSEDISCEFEAPETLRLANEERYMYLEVENLERGMDGVLKRLNAWKPYSIFENSVLNYKLNACEI